MTEAVQGDSVWRSRVGWFATAMAIIMYSSSIQQILLNLDGHPGSLMLPIATCINATAWTLYGAMKKRRPDWIIVTSNVPGIVLGAVTAITTIAA